MKKLKEAEDASEIWGLSDYKDGDTVHCRQEPSVNRCGEYGARTVSMRSVLTGNRGQVTPDQEKGFHQPS